MFHKKSHKKRYIPYWISVSLFAGVFSVALEANTAIAPTEVSLPPANAPLTPALRENISTWLDWQEFSETGFLSKKSCDKKGEYNFCGGAYRETPIEGFSAQLPAQDDMRITADETDIQADGLSILTGNVIIVQPNRQVNADRVYIYQDPKTKQITQIDLFGHVAVREAGKVMYGDEGHMLPEEHEGYVDNAIYRMSLSQPRQLESTELLQAWGRASSIEQDKEVYHLENATYTTCPPKDSSWQIKAKDMTLDKESGRGVAKHATLDFKNMPVFYFPYYDFPIDDRRQSGFLTPIAGYTTNLGMNFGLPYYWNMAPNYDMLITPSYYSDRGFNLGTDFRFLTEKSQGELAFNGIANDKAFQEYIDDNPEELSGESNNRYEVYLKDRTQFNPNWAFNTQYHHVSDDYYLQDFGTNIAETTENQLLQQADVDFSSDHWSSVLMMQHYQTLNPINQTPVADVYSRYPQWMVNGNYANLPGGVNFNINNEYDNFVWTSDNESTAPVGGRYHTNPVFTRPIMDPSGYIKPTFQIQETYYGLSDNPTIDDPTDSTLNPNMNILVPQTSLDSSIYFDKPMSFWGKDWTQTLEPRLYYLYVPYVNQTEVPNFDSGYNIFTYDQLFRPNRFAGIDRVGDSNQVSAALMSRFLDADSGTETFHWGIGQTYYLEDRQVQLMQLQDPDAVYADSPNSAGYMSPTDTYSPIASQISYHFTPVWSLVGDGAWDQNVNELNNATTNLHFQPGVNEIVNIAYSFLVNGDQVGVTDTETEDGNLNQVILSYAWPFTPNHQWSTFGSWTQNVSHNYPMNYSFGVQYEDCCWAIRLLGGKMYDSLDTDNNPVYNNAIYLQLLLKGLGNVAGSSPAIIMNTVPGYEDVFK